MIPKKTTREEAQQAWEDAKSFQGLCELMARFIEGTSPYRPGYFGEGVDEETKDIVPYLAAFNRAGFMTTNSQPAIYQADYKQRACVDGFAFEPVARRLARLALHTSLHVVIVPPGYSREHRTPITLDGFRPFTWSGFTNFEELESFAEACNPTTMQELQQAWSVSIIDLEWGRADYLWEEVAKAIVYSEVPADAEGIDSTFNF